MQGAGREQGRGEAGLRCSIRLVGIIREKMGTGRDRSGTRERDTYVISKEGFAAILWLCRQCMQA